MKPTWKDVSSHSRGDKDRTPRTWELVVGALRLVVTRHIHAEPDQWVAKAPPFVGGLGGFYVLGPKDIDEAKREAINLLTAQLSDALRDAKAAR